MKKRATFPFRLPLFISFLYIVSFFVLIFFIFPILWTFVSVNPASVLDYLKNPTVINAILVTITSATITTLLSLVFGGSLGYLLARKMVPGTRFISAIIDLPLALPHSVAGILLLFIFGRVGLIGQLFQTDYGTIFTRTIVGIVIAQSFVSTPILIQGAKETFEMVNEELEYYSLILGGSKTRTFFKITLPLSSSGLLANSLLCWARAASEFGAVIFLAYYPLTAPVLVYDLYSSKGLAGALPVVIIIIIYSTVIFLLAKYAIVKTVRGKMYVRAY